MIILLHFSFLPCLGRAVVRVVPVGLTCPAMTFLLPGAWAIPIGLASRPYLPLCPGRAGAGAILDGLACLAVSFSLFRAAGTWAIPIGVASRPYLPLCPGWARAGAILDRLACPALSFSLFGAAGAWAPLSGWHPGRIFLFVQGGSGQGPTLKGWLALLCHLSCPGPDLPPCTGRAEPGGGERLYLPLRLERAEVWPPLSGRLARWRLQDVVPALVVRFCFSCAGVIDPGALVPLAQCCLVRSASRADPVWTGLGLLVSLQYSHCRLHWTPYVTSYQCGGHQGLRGPPGSPGPTGPSALPWVTSAG